MAPPIPVLKIYGVRLASNSLIANASTFQLNGQRGAAREFVIDMGVLPIDFRQNFHPVYSVALRFLVSSVLSF